MVATTSTSSTTTDTAGLLHAILCDIRDYLATAPSATPTVDTDPLLRTRLLDLAKAGTIVKELAGFLFRNPSSSVQADHADDIPFSSPDALKIMGYLVSRDPQTYLKVSSRAIRDEAHRLSNLHAPAVLYVSPELTAVMIHQLSSGTDVEVSQNATQALVICCKALGPAFVETAVGALVAAWQSAMDLLSTTRRGEASTVCVRCAAAVVDVAVFENYAMQSAIASGALDLLVRLVTDATDPLLQMSMLDLVETLAAARPTHPQRVAWLLSDAILHPILSLAGGLLEDNSEPDPILGGPALRVVASLCKLGDSQHTIMLDVSADLPIRELHRALRNFDATSELDRLAFVDAVSSLASSSPTAMALVLNDVVTRDLWLSLSVAQPKLKAAILVSIARVLDPLPDVNLAGELMEPNRISGEWGMRLYALLGTVNGPESTDLLLSLVRSPITETRLGAYCLLEAVAKLPMGGQVLFTHGRFYEFLIGRDVETTKEGREAKYSIVQAVLHSEVKGLLSNEIVRALERYISQGPHFMPAIRWEVAVQ